MIEKTERLRVFVDADVLFAGAAPPSGASHVVLELAELGMIQAIISNQVRVEVERNLAAKLPAALPAFRAVVDLCCREIQDPPTRQSDDLAASGLAHPKDAPILAAALGASCEWLLTFNIRDYRPADRIRVATPGEFLAEARRWLAGMPSAQR